MISKVGIKTGQDANIGVVSFNDGNNDINWQIMSFDLPGSGYTDFHFSDWFNWNKDALAITLSDPLIGLNILFIVGSTAVDQGVFPILNVYGFLANGDNNPIGKMTLYFNDFDSQPFHYGSDVTYQGYRALICTDIIGSVRGAKYLRMFIANKEDQNPSVNFKLLLSIYPGSISDAQIEGLPGAYENH